MNKILSLAAVAGLSVVSLNASAQNTYFELGYSQYMEDDAELNVDMSIPMLMGTVGYNVTDSFAVEGFLGMGVSEDTVTVYDVDVDAEINYIYGINLKASANFTESFSGFAKLGYASTEVEVSVAGFGSESVDDSGTLFGAGLEYDFSESVYGTASYMGYNSDGGAFNIGVGMNF